MSEAHARDTDPATSHEAADSVTPYLRMRQEAVLTVLQAHGPMPDFVLVELYQKLPMPAQAESGIRTRRAELTHQGWVVNTGRRVETPSGRGAIVWAAL